MAGHKVKAEEEYDSNVISDAYDTNEEGEVEPSEDELTNVQYSETDTKDKEKAPIPGPSRIPATPIKRRQTETKAKKNLPH